MAMNLNIMTRKIAILGGCFDPIHKGHIALATSTLEQVDVDEVWFMPEYNPPHKDIKNISDFNHRFNMTNLAIEGFDKFKCIDFEKKLYDSKVLNVTSTYKVLKELEKVCANTEFLLIIGYDSLFNLETWKDPQKLLSEYKFIIASREMNNKVDEVAEINLLKQKYGFRSTILKFDNVNISATQIRQAFAYGNEDDIKDYLPEAVFEYIKNNNLYKLK